SWSSLTRGLNNEIYLKVLREDSKQRGLLYLGTERGMLVSRDDGRNWESLQLNLPTVAIADMVVAGDDLVLGTLGRSAWILDDLTPIREMSPAITKTAVHLFPPLPAIRWTYSQPTWGSEEGGNSNPPEGAIINYYLAEVPEDAVILEVLDSSGKVIRKLSSELEAPYIAPDHPDANPYDEPAADLEAVKGLNRAAWDLAHEGARRIPDSTNDAGDVNVGPMAVPGEYRLRLTAGGKGVEQPLTVLPDPRADSNIRDLQAQSEYLLATRDRITALVLDVEYLRKIRAQLKARGKEAAEDSRAKRLLALGESAIEKITAIEKLLYNPNAEVNYDILAGREGGAKLYSRLGWLYLTGFDHNGPPTQGMREVSRELSTLYDQATVELQQLFDNDLAQINELAAELGFTYLSIKRF
ncbi:MAG: hypothetical protein WBM68_03490, partial [Woeseia sp.]